MKLEWEVIEGSIGHGTTVRRAKVPNGWLVRVEEWHSSVATIVGFTHVPDPNWKWLVDKEGAK